MNRLVKTLFLLTVTTSTVVARVILIRHAGSHHYPRYAFKYSVHDHKTNDHKEHWETRNGDLVKGAYSLLDPDGKLRMVDYWADDANGFIADVKRLGPSEVPPAVPAKPAPVAEPQEHAIPEPEDATLAPEDAAQGVEDATLAPEDATLAPEDPPVTQEPVPVTHANDGVSQEPLLPLDLPENYGFGLGGDDAPFGHLYTSVTGTGSLQWDSKTGSYGGWVPLKSPKSKYATIFSKKYIDGKLHEWAIGPISLVGRTLVFKVKH